MHSLPFLRSFLTLACLAAALAGCSDPPRRAREVSPPVIRDIPSALRGTVGSEATLARAEPVLISGYGLVVGLPGTGGGDLDERIAATMERQLGLMGISRAAEDLVGTPFEGMTPRQILRSRDVAVVVVYAAISPGAPEGANFDVFVSAVSPSPDISLEGGLLWTTELRIGPPAHFGSYKTKEIASAYGPLFINPFAQNTRDGYGRNTGRILGGGRVVSPLPLQLVMDNEGHQRARAITSAINNRFPQQPGDPITARGNMGRRGDQSFGIIELSIPRPYRYRPAEFLNLLAHVQIDSSVPQEFARRYVETLKNEPYLADAMRWCLQALPHKASLPFLRNLYDDPQYGVRMAALRAGAGLNDALTAPHLKRLAKEGSREERIEAIELLGRLSAGPTVDMALQEQLSAPELTIRVAAYEALAERAEHAQMDRLRAYTASLPAAARISVRDLSIDPRTQLEIPGDTLQGVRRKVVSRRFLLDSVRGGEPLIYVTQSGRPRIVLFGDQLQLTKPTLVTAWDDRLMLACDSSSDDHRILYRTPDRLTVEGEIIPGLTTTAKVPSDLPSLIEFLAHEPTPEDPRPGLAMTYSQIVGAIHAFQQAGAIDAAFAVEEDMLRARLQAATQTPEGEDRPETILEAQEREKLRVFQPVAPETAQPKRSEPGSLLVPLPPPAPKDRK